VSFVILYNAALGDGFYGRGIIMVFNGLFSNVIVKSWNGFKLLADGAMD